MIPRATSLRLPLLFALCTAPALGAAEAAAQPLPAPTMTPAPGPGPAPWSPPGAPLLGPTAPLAPGPVAWEPGQPAPPGYRLRTRVSLGSVIGGATVLTLSYTVTMLIAGGIANTGVPGAFFAPIGGIPVVGAFPLSVLSMLNGAGPGTVGALIALGATQSIGFGILLRGLKAKKPIGIAPDCESPGYSLSPFVSPQSAGLVLGGAL